MAGSVRPAARSGASGRHPLHPGHRRVLEVGHRGRWIRARHAGTKRRSRSDRASRSAVFGDPASDRRMGGMPKVGGRAASDLNSRAMTAWRSAGLAGTVLAAACEHNAPRVPAAAGGAWSERCTPARATRAEPRRDKSPGEPGVPPRGGARVLTRQHPAPGRLPATGDRHATAAGYCWAHWRSAWLTATGAAEAKDSFKIAWSIYVGWMPWG